MYQGKHVQKRKTRRYKWNRSFVVLVSSLVLLVGVVGGSLAYLTTTTSDVTNTFTPGRVTCEIIEPGWEQDKTEKNNVTVKNTGNTDAFIRAAIVATWVDSDGNISAAKPEIGKDYTMSLGSDWTTVGDFYYYKQSVAPQGNTAELVVNAAPIPGKAPEGYTLCIDIIADAIQSNPMKAVQQSWGVTISSGSVTAYSG